jgi:hypothetical protein
MARLFVTPIPIPDVAGCFVGIPDRARKLADVPAIHSPTVTSGNCVATNAAEFALSNQFPMILKNAVVLVIGTLAF